MLTEVQQFSKWLRRKSPHSSTARHYTNDLKLFFHWADKPPSQVTLRDIDDYIEHCQQANHAIATVNRRLAAIRSFYHFLAVMDDHAPDNPVLPKRHFIRQGQRLPRDVEDADLKALFAIIEASQDGVSEYRAIRDQAMFLLMLRCGLRVGEVRELSLGDLYLQAPATGLPRLWVRGKNGSQRVVYLSNHTLVALNAWLATRPAAQDQALFLNRSGRRFSVTGIQNQLAGYCHQAGLWITCHQLRHTFGRHLVEAGVPPTTIQRLLGHVRLRTTQLYMHISDRQVQADYQAAMKQVDERFSQTGGTP